MTITADADDPLHDPVTDPRLVADVEASPDYWFIVLFRSLRESDLVAAGEAQEQLAELGIDVRFSRLLPDREVASE